MFESLNAFLSWQPPKLLETVSHGILPAGGKLVLAGEEATFKTMLSTYAGFRISQGQNLFGFKTLATRVGMLQLELTKPMFQSRLKKLVSQDGNLNTANIHFATAMELKLNRPTGLAQLLSGLHNLNPGLLIIDPLYKVLSADISDWQEMLRLLDNIDLISRQLNCAVWLVHHRRKHLIVGGEMLDLGTDELVGSSVLKDWADTILRLSYQEEDILRLDFPKVRNAPSILYPMMIKFNRRTLGFELQQPSVTVEEDT